MIPSDYTTMTTGQQALRHAAISLEAQFISEMLNASGFAKSRELFGGGAGEDQFTSMLSTEYAKEIAERGGFGLTQAIIESLMEKSDVQTSL